MTERGPANQHKDLRRRVTCRTELCRICDSWMMRPVVVIKLGRSRASAGNRSVAHGRGTDAEAAMRCLESPDNALALRSYTGVAASRLRQFEVVDGRPDPADDHIGCTPWHLRASKRS